MFIIRSFTALDLCEFKSSFENLNYNSKFDALIQSDSTKNSIIKIESLNPVWIDFFEGFEIKPTEENIVIGISQNKQNFHFVPELEKWVSSPDIIYYSCNYFREIIKYWRGSLNLNIKINNSTSQKMIKELKIGYWIIGNHIDYLSEFGIPKATSLQVKANRIIPLRDQNEVSIPRDIPISKLESVKYQDFKNQEPAKEGLLDKNKRVVQFYENIISDYIRLLFFIQIKSNFIYEFEQISEAPTISVLQKEGINYITNGIIESIRISKNKDRYTKYNYFYDQPFEIGVTCQIHRDLRDYTNQIIKNLNNNNPLYIPTHNLYFGFYLSEKPQYMKSVEHITDSSLYSSTFEITFKFLPEFQETYLYDRINNITLTSDWEEVAVQNDHETLALLKSRDYSVPVGVIETDQLNHDRFQNYSSDVSDSVGIIGDYTSRHIKVFNSPEIIDSVYLILPDYSVLVQISNIEGLLGDTDCRYIKAYHSFVSEGVTPLPINQGNLDNHIIERDLVHHVYIQIYESNIQNGVGAY